MEELKTDDFTVADPLLMGSSTTKTSNGDSPKYKVYPERWLVLAVCCFLALSNAMQWICLSSLDRHAQHHYRNESNDGSPQTSVSIITNQIFQFVAVCTGFFGMYITDNYGIRVAGLLGTTLNFIGATFRTISSHPFIDSFTLRESLLHLGSFIAASAQAFFLVLPSKIAECWFPGDQRAIANVLSFVANPAGVAIGTIAPSLIFPTEINIVWEFFYLTLGMFFLALLPFVLALFVRRKLPPTPPSASSASHHNDIDFIGSIMSCLTNVQFCIQIVLFAFAFSLLWGCMIFLDGPLQKQGYDLKGYPTAVCAIVGTFTSLLAGHIADKTRKFKEIIIFCTIGFATSMAMLRLYLEKYRTSELDSVVIYILCGCLGACSIPQFPIGVELGVETTFPVLEATSSGVLVIFGSLFMCIIPNVLHFSERLRVYTGGYEWKFALDVMCCLSLVSVILSVFFMKPRYRRMELENANVEHPAMNNQTIEDARSSPSFEMRQN